MALVADKGTDFKMLNQKKRQKAARKEKAIKDGRKSTEEDLESVDEGSDDEDGGVTLGNEEEESSSDDEVEESLQVCCIPQFTTHG